MRVEAEYNDRPHNLTLQVSDRELSELAAVLGRMSAAGPTSDLWLVVIELCRKKGLPYTCETVWPDDKWKWPVVYNVGLLDQNGYPEWTKE